MKTYHRRPSDDLAIDDSVAAWCLDGAVLWFGTTLENALAERVNQGDAKDPRWENKYTLAQLLDPSFRLPRPQPVKPQSASGGFGALLAMAKQKGSGVKLWKTVA